MTDPQVYSTLSDDAVAAVFAPAAACTEGVPLLAERAEIMRKNGTILCTVRALQGLSSAGS